MAAPSSRPLPGTPERVREPRQQEFSSPNHVLSPKKYHYYDAVKSLKKRELRGFQGKVAHTLAPGSAEKQAKAIQRHYAELRKIKHASKKRKQEEEDVLGSLEKPDVTICVKKEGYVVKQEGKVREFGIHDVVLKGGELQRRIFPKSGDGVVTLPGLEILRLLDRQRKREITQPFQKLVLESINGDRGGKEEAGEVEGVNRDPALGFPEKSLDSDRQL